MKTPSLVWALLLAVLAPAVQAQQTPAAAQEAAVRPGGLQPGTIQTASWPSIKGARVSCTSGKADRYPCSNIDLNAFVSTIEMGGQSTANDIWGWADPETGREYAVVGLKEGTAFVDVTDPVSPRVLGMLPSHGGINSFWRDVKVYGNHALIVSEAFDHGLQIFDLTQLRDVEQTPVTFEETAHYDAFGAAHNVVVNEETGYAFAVGIQGRQTTIGCGPGLHMIDLRTPTAPTFAGCFNSTVGRGYTHDAQCVIYRGPDADYQGREICVNADEQGIAIVDITDKTRPRQIATATYPNVGYAHQGWFTEDQAYFFLDDELDESGGVPQTRTLIWDMEDLDDPILHQEYTADSQVYDHNQYIAGDYVFQANYRGGLHILDISGVADQNVREVAFFDTYPMSDDGGFGGAWSVYPYLPSGNIIVSDMNSGLYVVTPTQISVAAERDAEVPSGFVLTAAYPNPFNPVTVFTLTLDAGQPVRVAVYDVLVREVALLHDGPLSAGTTTLRFEAPAGASSGTYIVKATGATASATQTVTLLK